MGSIKRIRKKYRVPYQKWQKNRIDEERGLLKEYGLKNKTELWRFSSALTRLKTLAKEAIYATSAQSDKESEQLLAKLRNMGLLHEASMLTDVLKLNDKDLLERRLQTIVFRQGLARSVSQARQFISHGHICVDGIRISSPAYIVRKAEESRITFREASTLSDAQHPERVIKVVPVHKPSAESSAEAVTGTETAGVPSKQSN